MSAYVTVLAVLLLLAGTTPAEVKTQTVDYEVDGTSLKGHLFYDDSTTGKRPGVIVVHEWWGLNDYARSRAESLAKMGYVAFALDMYDGKVTDHPEKAGEWSGFLAKNREIARTRFSKALEILKTNSVCDPDQIAAIGYCFGGNVVLSMAMAGFDLDAVVSFHGSLPQAPPSGDIKASILVCHGAADNFISPEQISTFKANLSGTDADWQFVSYGGAQHSFTNKGADKRGIPGLQYDETADRRSWDAMQDLFSEIW